MSDQALTYLHANAVEGSEPAWLAERRRSARASFADSGFPTRRVEAWKYSDLTRALGKSEWKAAEPVSGGLILPAGIANPFAGIDGHVIVLVNGYVRLDLSSLSVLPAGVDVSALSDALARGHKYESQFDAAGPGSLAPIAALNVACARDGAVIRVADGAQVDRPIIILSYSIGGVQAAAHTRHIVELGAGAKATILEAHLGWDGAYLSDSVVNVRLGEKASLGHFRVQDEDMSALHVSTILAELAAEADYRSATLALGSAFARTQSAVRFEGEGAHAEAHTAFALANRQHHDSTIVVDHAVPNCTSEALSKGVLDDEAVGVFQGRVIVAPQAQKSDATQMSNALLLSRDAAMNAKPELEIYADDVQCAHGSTIGELDADAIFYLRSRGIDEETARGLLIAAFLDEALELVTHEEAREAMKQAASNWFAGEDAS